MLCDKCGHIAGQRGVELIRIGQSEPLQLCPVCLHQVAIFESRDGSLLPFLQNMETNGRGQVWRRGPEAYLLRAAALGSIRTASEASRRQPPVNPPAPREEPHEAAPPPLVAVAPTPVAMQWVSSKGPDPGPELRAPLATRMKQLHARPRFSKAGRWLPAAAVVTLALSMAALFLLVSEQEPQRYVSLYLTDLPGGLERLEVTLAGCVVGTEERPLRLEAPVIELSDLQGPEEAVRVCSGWVDGDTDQSIAIQFQSARGYRADAWIELAIPHSRLAMPEGLPPADGTGASALLDINLETSVVDQDGNLTFEPFVQSVYHQNTTQPTLDPARLVKVDFPEQMLDDPRPARKDDACPRAEPCKPGDAGRPGPARPAPAPDPSCPSLVSAVATCPSLPTAMTSEASPARSTSPKASVPPAAFPDVPSDPSPADDEDVSASALLLSWEGGHAYGGALTFTVTVDGVTICSTSETSCPLDAVGPGSRHVWHVSASTEDGKKRRGPDWSFTSLRAPDAPALASPADGSGVQPGGATLEWSASDPDGDPLEFRVLTGSSSTPDQVSCEWQRQTMCKLPSLSASTTFYWRVIVRDEGGLEREGPVWSFVTSESASSGGPPKCIVTVSTICLDGASGKDPKPSRP